MRANRQRISNYSIQWENERHKDRIASMRELLDNVDNDPQKKDRIKKCECKICFYQTGGRIGGADINYVNKRKRELPEVKVCQ